MRITHLDTQIPEQSADGPQEARLPGLTAPTAGDQELASGNGGFTPVTPGERELASGNGGFTALTAREQKLVANRGGADVTPTDNEPSTLQRTLADPDTGQVGVLGRRHRVLGMAPQPVRRPDLVVGPGDEAGGRGAPDGVGRSPHAGVTRPRRSVRLVHARRSPGAWCRWRPDRVTYAGQMSIRVSIHLPSPDEESGAQRTPSMDVT